MDLFDLFVRIKVDDGELNNLSGAADKAKSSIGGKLATAGKVGAAGMAVLAAATVAVIGYLKNATSEVAEYGNRVDKMSQKMGLSATAFQEWDFVLQHCDISIDSMKTSMKTLANAAEKANPAFERIGLTQQQIASMSQEELFGATIKGLQSVTDTTERTYLAGQLLGRGATELGPLLNMTAEETEALKQQLHDMGGVMSDEAVKAAAQYEDSLQNMQMSLTALRNNMLSEFLPGFSQVMDGITLLVSGQDGGVEMIGQGIESVVNTIAEAIPKISETIAEMAPEIGSAVATIAVALVEAMPTILEAGVTIAGAFVVALIEGLSQAAGELFSAASALVETHIIEPIRQKLSELKAAVQGKFKEAEQGIRNAWSGIVSFFQGIVSGIIGVFAGIVSGIVNFFSNAAASARNAWSGIVGFFAGIVSGIIGAVSGIVGAIAGFFSAAASAAISAFTSIVGKVRSVANSVVSAFASLPGRFFQIGAHIVSNLISGLLSGLGRLKSAASQLAGVLSIFKHSVPTTGPFAHDDKWMFHFVENLVAGLEAGQPMLDNAVEDVANGITSVLNLSGKGFDLGQSTLLAFVEGISLSEQAKRKVEQVGKEISDALTGQIGYLNQRLSDMEALEEQEAYEKELKEYQKNLADKKKKLAEAEAKDQESIRQEIADLEQNWREKEIDRERKATKERLQIRIDALEELKDAYDDAMAEIKKSETRMSDKLKDYGKLFETVHDELKDTDVFGLIDLQGQIDAINHYGDALEQLRERGVSDSLMEEIVELGIDDATKYADKLLWLSDEYFDQYLQKWEEKQKAAERIASTFYAPEKSEVNNEYLEQFNKLLTETDRQYIDLKFETARTADASAELKSAIDAESSSYVKLQKELQQTIALQRELNGLSRETVSFSDSAIARTSAAQINASSGLSKAVNVTVSGNIVTPDGKALSNFIMKDLQEVSAANGTPIANK